MLLVMVLASKSFHSKRMGKASTQSHGSANDLREFCEGSANDLRTICNGLRRICERSENVLRSPGRLRIDKDAMLTHERGRLETT